MKIYITRKLLGEPEKLHKQNGFRFGVYNEDKPMPRDEFPAKPKKVKY